MEYKTTDMIIDEDVYNQSDNVIKLSANGLEELQSILLYIMLTRSFPVKKVLGKNGYW